MQSQTADFDPGAATLANSTKQRGLTSGLVPPAGELHETYALSFVLNHLLYNAKT